MNLKKGTEAAQYLTFMLDQEYYAINVFKVREVLEVRRITKVPRMDRFMRGVINLRGSVVPVADLRLKFNLPETESSIDTSIIVTEVSLDDVRTVVGILVDSVQEVIELQAEHIEAAPQVGANIEMDFIQGMANRDDDFIIILDIDKVFSAKEIDLVRENISPKDPVPVEESE